MSKLCQCKKQFIRDLFISTVKDAEESADDMYIYPIDEVAYSTSKTEEVSKILESDCVCEKKEETSYDRSKTVGLHIGNGHFELNSNYFAPTKENQSQSPCEHEWQPVKALARIGECYDLTPEGKRHHQYYAGVWGCYKEECGLVTCKNPNVST